MNAFLHPQRLSITFQLSEKQLGNFAGLKEKGATAEIVLPFAEEAGVRTESPVVRVGEGPLRIYKNEYDKPPVSHWPVRSSCVIKEGDPGFASFEKAIETIEEKGWDKGPGTASGALQPPPSLGSAHPTAEDASKDDPLLASKEDE